jgi:MFS family permease
MFTGFSMASVSIAYMISMPLVFKMTDCMSRRGVIFIGMILLVLGILITGLDHIYSFVDPGAFTIAGLAVFGFGFAMITIPVMPEILESIEESDKIVPGYDEQ